MKNDLSYDTLTSYSDEGSAVGVKERIAKNLTLLRKEHKLTQQALAEKLNYSDKAISRWERGETLPDVETLCRVCDLYGVRFEYLLIEEHPEGERAESKKVRNLTVRLLVTLIAVCTVWVVATVAYTCGRMMGVERCWTLFIWALPLTGLVSVICNRMLIRSRLMAVIAGSLTVWCLLLSIYLQLLVFRNLWPLFLIGVPIQAMIILVFAVRLSRR